MEIDIWSLSDFGLMLAGIASFFITILKLQSERSKFVNRMDYEFLRESSELIRQQNNILTVRVSNLETNYNECLKLVKEYEKDVITYDDKF